MKEPTRDTFVMLLNPFLEVMWAWSNGGSVRNHSAEHWWCPKTSWRWNNTGRSQWWKQDTGQLSILMCQILAQALQLILRGPLCSQTGARMIAGRVNVAWIQCRQRMRQNRTTACSSIPCTASTAPAVAFLPGAMCLQIQGCQWGKHLSYHQRQLRHWSFPGTQIISLSQSSFEFFPMNVNILGVLCWLQLHRLEFKSALWTPEDGSLRRIGEDVNKESHHPTQQSPALAGSLSGNCPDFWSSPPPPSKLLGSQQSHWNLGNDVLFLFTLWEQFLTKWERDISVVCQVLENSASAKCQASGTCCWAWGKGETQRGFAQWLETPSLVLDPHWEATMSSRMKIFSTRIGLVWE